MNSDEVPFSWKEVLSPFHLGVVLIVFILDQASKFAVVTYIRFGTRVEVMPFLNLVYTKNRGAAFGMFHESGGLFRFLFFGVVTVVCLYLLIYWLGTTPPADKLKRFCFALIMGGAFGNLLDRLWHGEVTDFIDVYYQEHHFYIFNIADSGISVGVTLLLVSMLPWSKWIKKPKGA